MQNKILILGACGQIGSELTRILRKNHGNEAVVATDIRPSNKELVESGVFEILDACDKSAVKDCIDRHEIDTVYLMAAMLSAKAEQHPQKAWDLNMSSLFCCLELAREGNFKKLFWPSSIAVFGPTTPKTNTPQRTIIEPTTVYGITKQVGERWCEYYYRNYNVDVRSVRYPGIISWRTPPGGGTTDYAIEIFHKAIENGHYDSFIDRGTSLPMMFMADAIRATLEIMEAPAERIKIRSSYNLAAVSFTPEELAEQIQEMIPEFTVEYLPDFRQGIADTWPNSIDDSEARSDWAWQHEFGLEEICREMIVNLRQTLLT